MTGQAKRGDGWLGGAAGGLVGAGVAQAMVTGGWAGRVAQAEATGGWGDGQWLGRGDDGWPG